MRNYLYILLCLFLTANIQAQDYNIKDKTKYYVKNIDQFNNYSSNGWKILDDGQLKTVAKALDISKSEAEKVIESTYYTKQPANKKDKDVGYVMYKICELKGYKNGIYSYTNTNDVLYLMYVPNELNTHMPPDKIAANGKGFFQVVLYENVSTTPLSSSYYTAAACARDDNYSFGFRYGNKGNDSIVISKVIQTGPADKAGLKEGDVIVEVNQTNIRYRSGKNAAPFFKECPFTNNTFKILRNNNEITLKIDKTNAKSLELICSTGNCENGDCEFEHINGYKIKATCKDGNVVGKVQFISGNGIIFYEGEAKNYTTSIQKYNIRYNGYGIEKYTNGDRYEGNFNHGEKDGEGIYYMANGTQNKGTWRSNKYYDEISVGFEDNRFESFTLRVHLYDQNKFFLSNMSEKTFKEGELNKLKNRYSMSDAEVDKLLKLCDFKYKPENLNSPAKLKSLINANQEKYPYEVYLLENLEGTDGEFYSVLRMPEPGNRWLPDAMNFKDGNALYFLAPYTEVKLVSYIDHANYKQQQEAAEFWKKTEEKNAANLSAYFNERSKNEYKGIAIYQFSYWDYNLRREDFSYTFVSVFGPPGQELSNADYEAMHKLAGATGSKIAMEYKKGMSETDAEKFAASKTGVHRYSITKRYNYYMPQTNYSSNDEAKKQLNDEEIKKIDKELEEAEQRASELTQEIIDDKTLEKMELRKKIGQEIFSTNGNIINEPDKVQVIDILTSDKYYNENKKFIGKTGTVEGSLIENPDGSYHGTIKFPDEKQSTIFYSVKIKSIP